MAFAPSRRHVAWLLILGLSALLPTPAVRAEAPPPPPPACRWLSADALLYAELVRPETTWKRFGDPRFQELLRSLPAYRNYLESDPYRQFRTGVDFLTGLLDTTLDEGLDKLVKHAAISVEVGPNKSPWILLVVTAKDPKFLEKAHQTIMDAARKDAEEKGKPDPIKSHSYRDVIGYQFAPGKGHIILGDALILSNEGDALKAFVDRSLGAKDFKSLTDDPDFRVRRAAVADSAFVWGWARLEALRKLDPKRFGGPDEQVNPLGTLLFGSWLEGMRKASWTTVSLTWTDEELSGEIALATPKDLSKSPLGRLVPPRGQGAAAVLTPPGTLASLSLWRDLASVWEVRTDLLPPEAIQGLAGLDSFAGQFFGAKDFGSGVLDALSHDWRLVVAKQEFGGEGAPVPDLKLPGAALVVKLKPGSDDFAVRLKVAFQSFLGLVNLGAAETKAPPMILGSEVFEGVTIATGKFLPPKEKPADDEPVHVRHNLSPSSAQVGDDFILSTSIDLTRKLVATLKNAKTQPTDATIVLSADGSEIAKLMKDNRARLVQQNMLEEGNDKPTAESEIDSLIALIRYLGQGRLMIADGDDASRLKLVFRLAKDAGSAQ